MNKTATILTEDFAGMKSQAIGFAERAGFQQAICNLYPKKPWSLISAPYWPFPLRAVEPFSIDKNNQIIISVGSIGGVINSTIRLKDRPAIHIQNPRINANKFDLIIVNPHDNLTGRNIIISRTALHHISKSLLEKNKIKWSPFFQTFNKPLVSVLIGGNNGRFTLGKKEAIHISHQLKLLIQEENIAIALTPSRRTNPEAIQIFKEILSPMGAYIWDGVGDNPYLGLLACADIILVTMDSVSMISEAVATSAPVMIISLPGQSKRISSFIQSMQKENRIKLFSGTLNIWNISPLDDTDEVIFKAKRQLNL